MNIRISLNLLPLGSNPIIIHLRNRKQITCLLGRRFHLQTIMRYLVPIAICVCTLMAPRFVSADSITIDRVVFSNVYIVAGTAMYYIQNPADGTTISVPKSEIDDSDVTISSDRIERRRLHEAWKIKRGLRKTGQPLTISYDEWRNRLNITVHPVEARQATISLDGPVSLNGIRAVQSDNGVVHISNLRRSARSAGLNGRKLFMDSDGVPIMTNIPEQFRGPEYVEVVIHFDRIDIPERFRMAPTRSLRGPAGSSVEAIVQHYARRYRLDENLLYAIIKAESDGNQYAVSSAGARGLMQLMPGTAREMGVKDIFDPAENIAGGTQYLSKLASIYKGDMTLALAGYNAGPGNVKKYGGIPPFEETREYIRRVQQLQRSYKRRGIPQFDIANSEPVEANYLPPESSQYYRILLDNGLSVTAEEVYIENDRYIYIFKGRSGHFAYDQVLAVYEPS